MSKPRVRSMRLLVAAAGIALLAAACVPPAPPQPPLAPPPPDIGQPANSPTLTTNAAFITTSSGTALANPWDVAFTPDGTRGLFTERIGRISQFDPATGGATLVGTVPGVQQSGESGLLGLAVDPSFATNHFIYVCASRGSNEVLRIVVNLAAPAGTGLGTPTVMLTGMPQNSFHDGCRVRFEPGSNPAALWVSMGDAGIGPGPQNLMSPAGKIMRTRVDQPSNLLEPYPGNPRIANPKPESLIYSVGHRNPQGIAFQPGSNQAYDSEHGPNINDEVNRLGAGGNAGWDPTNGSDYDQSKPMTDLAKFPFATRPAWRSGDSFTLAPSGATFLSGAQWKSWDGALVVAFLKDSKIRVMFLDGNGNVSGAFPTLTGHGRLRSVAQGPDGTLYVSTDNGSGSDAIMKVTPS